MFGDIPEVLCVSLGCWQFELGEVGGSQLRLKLLNGRQ